MPPQPSFAIAVAAVLCAWLSSANFRAQPQTPDEEPPQAGAAGRAADQAQQPPSRVPAEGRANAPVARRPIVITDEATLKAFEEWYRNRETPPSAAIARLAIEARAQSDRALLVVELDVVVRPEEEWVLLPLEMPEADLVDQPRHEGPGQALPAPFDDQRGYAWWFRGQGKHRLVMQLVAPIRAQGAQRRLQLGLPPAAASVCRVTTAHARVTAKAPERTTLAVKSSGAETTIEAVGLGRRLDLLWQPLPEAVVGSSPLEVSSSVNCTLADGETATLEVSQRIQSIGQQGSFDRVTVTLPEMTELLRIEGTEYSAHQPDPAAPSRMIVQLKRASEGPIELRYTARRRLPEAGQPFTIEGFEVPEAAVHNGFVALEVVGGFRLVHVAPEDRYLQRINVADLPSNLRQPQTAQAFRFFRRMRLSLALQRVLPLINADAAYLASCSPDHLELDAQFRLNILRAGLQRLSFAWPGFRQSGWGQPTLDVPGHSEARLLETGADPDRIEIDLAAPLKGSVTVRLRARQPLAPHGVPRDLALPALAGAMIGSASLTLVHPENLQIQISGSVATAGPSDFEPAVPRELSRLPRKTFSIDGAAPRVTLTSRRLSRTIVASTAARVSLKAGVARVRQIIHFEVSHEPVDELVLRVPAALANSRIEIEEGFSQRRISKGDEQTFLVVGINPRRTGDISIEARYNHPAPQAAAELDNGQVEVPLLQPDAFEYQLTELLVSDAAGRTPHIADSAWQPMASPGAASQFAFAGGDPLVHLQLSRVQSRAPDLAGMLARCRLGSDGGLRCRLQFEAPAELEEIPLVMPAGVRPLAAWCNGRPVELSEVPGSPGRLVARAAAAGTKPSSWTIDVAGPAIAPLRLGGRVSWQLPGLPPAWQPGEMVWLVELPATVHLLDVPPGCSPAYHWEFAGGWRRRSDGHIQALPPWPGEPADADSFDVNRYLLRATVAGAALVVPVVTRAALVAMTAGIGLAGVLVLVHARRLANFRVLALLVAGASVVAVWYSEPLLLLLQPVVLGAVLSAFYFAVDSLAKSGQRRSAALATGSGVVALSSAHAPALAASAGKSDKTAARAPVVPADAASSLSESGSRA